MKNLKTLVCGMVVAALGLSARADTIYDSFGSYNGHAFGMSNGQEVGNEISISPGNAWTLTNFVIEYYTPNSSFTTSVGIDVRFYLNDGAVTNTFHAPGTMFYDSGWYYGMTANASTNYWTVNYSGSDLTSLTQKLPSDFTFTVTFTNLDANNLVSLPLATNMTTSYAQTFGDYWLNSDGNWALMSTNAANANFVASFAGTVPEPTTFALAALGGAALLGLKLRRKR